MKIEIIGYSTIKGKFHELKKMSNQDSYIVKKYKFGTILVVSDGIGSHPHSDVGSEAVCKAVCGAIQLWQQKGCNEPRLLIPLIHSLWGINVYPYAKNECGATCLFAYVSNAGNLYLGQLGDGNIYVSIENEIKLLKTKEDEFSNVTSEMSGISSFHEWSIKTYDVRDKLIKICMMTDGVSETLKEDTKQEFVELIWKKIEQCENLQTRNMLIYSLLANWNSINAGDDRTLISYEKK